MKKMFLSVVSQLVLPFFTDGTKRSMILCFSLLSAANVAAQVQVSGKLVDDRKAPVEFANIVFQSGDSFQGTVSDEEGKFSIGVSAGDYAFRISVIGYAHFEKALSIREDTDLGEIVLTPSTVDIGEVTVKAQRTVRKSDRFVINLANDPGVFGKTGSDILSMSPGVFVQERDGTVSINGKSGTRVTVNGRLLREQGADLIRYLQTLRAEDILRIEILPAAGAGFDADIAGGVIGITLKRLRDDGLNGNAALLYALAPGEDVFSLSPSFGMNYKSNRVGVYATLNCDDNRAVEHAVEEADFVTVDRSIRSATELPTAHRTGRVRIGGTYDLSARQSVGVELYASDDRRKNKSFTDLTETTGTGLKYIRNEMDHEVMFEYMHGADRRENEPYSSINAFSENIAAAYAVFSSRVGSIGYSVGLRG